jgi:hypothetical protein
MIGRVACVLLWGAAILCLVMERRIAALIFLIAGVLCFRLDDKKTKKKEIMEFKPSNHSHFCPKCRGHKYCPQITHCKKADEAVCMDCHAESLTVERETGKWQGEYSTQYGRVTKGKLEGKTKP